MRLLVIVLLALVAALGIAYAGFFLWLAECDSPSGDADRVLLPAVRAFEMANLRSSGGVGNLDAKFRSRYPGLIGLDEYRVVTKKVAGGYDVVIEPRRWCFCRQTFVLHDGGRRLEVIDPAVQF